MVTLLTWYLVFFKENDSVITLGLKTDTCTDTHTNTHTNTHTHTHKHTHTHTNRNPYFYLLIKSLRESFTQTSWNVKSSGP